MTSPSVSEEMIRALSRQTDNMAFVLNHASVPDEWCDKFMRELEEDRKALAHLPAGSEAVKPLEGLPLSPTGHHEESDPYPRFAAPPSTPPAANVQDEPEWPDLDTDDPDIALVAKAIAENGFGRPWDDFLACNAHDTDQNDLIEYATAAVIALRSKQAPTVAVPDEGDEPKSLRSAVKTLIRCLEFDGTLIDPVKYLRIALEEYPEDIRARAEQRETPSVLVGEEPEPQVGVDFTKPAPVASEAGSLMHRAVASSATTGAGTGSATDKLPAVPAGEVSPYIQQEIEMMIAERIRSTDRTRDYRRTKEAAEFLRDMIAATPSQSGGQ